MSTHQLGGASISARTRTPSLHLSRLCELLTQALKPEIAQAPSFLRYAEGRLHVDLREALRRLYKVPGFSVDLAPGPDTGFLRDLELPPRGTIAKMGGRLLPGTDGKTTAAIEKLQEIIRRELEGVLPEQALRSLVAPSARESLDRLADRLHVKAPAPLAMATLVPVGFAAADRKVADREKDVARVLSAVETVEGRDWLDRLTEGIKNRLKNEDLDDDDIAPILGSIVSQREQPGSQIRRFLDFLDDEALSRVRLQVTFKLMESIAGHAKNRD